MLTGGTHDFEGLVVLEGVAEADLVLGKDSEEVLVALLEKKSAHCTICRISRIIMSRFLFKNRINRI